MEAKKPSVGLRNPDHYFQTIRYDWSARTPLSILTDFEELHILDCRIKPDIRYIKLKITFKWRLSWNLAVRRK